MNVCILFYNLGGYHLARFDAAKRMCDANGWTLGGIEIAGSTEEHPWGDVKRPGYIRTLMPFRNDPQPTVGDPDLLTSALRELKPDVIAIPGWGYDFSRIAIRWARKNHCRLILMSESKKDDSPRNFLIELVKKHYCVNKFDSALVGGKKHRDYLIELGMDQTGIFTGYDVVDNQHFTRSAQTARGGKPGSRPDGLPDRPYFLAATRFLPRKNLSMLIDGFAAAINSGKMKADYDLVVLGGGTPEQEKSIGDQIVRLKLERRIHLPGFVEYSLIPTWYAYADAFAHPAISEQWGLVVNEAMACSLPVLLSNTCGCYPELLDEGVNGFSFDPHRADDLARALIDISRADLKKMGDASLQKINTEFSTDEFASGLLSAIRTIPELSLE